MKVAILQKVIPEFRRGLFQKLYELKDVQLKVFYGSSPTTGAMRNTKYDITHFAKKIFTIPYLFKKYRVFHPTLFYHLVKYSPSIIITEPSTYFPNNVIAFIYAKLFSRKFIWWEAGHIGDFSGFRKIIEPIIKYLIKSSDGYLCYSSVAKGQLIKRYNVSADNIIIAQNTLDNIYEHTIEIELNLKEKLGIEKDEKIYTYIGAIEKRKKLEILFDAIKELEKPEETHLLIIGDGMDLNYYKNYSEKINLERIHFLGRLSLEQGNPYLALSNFVILPSEGGLAINHALSCGTPVICGINDGTEKDLIIEGFNGFVIPGIDSHKLAVLLNKKMFEFEGIAEHYYNNFSIDNMINAFIILIKNLH